MQSSIFRTALAASLVAFLAVPAFADDSAAYSAGMASGRPTTPLLPDERDEPLRLLALVGPVVAISLLTILGLTITFRALGHEMRERRIVYRQRGHREP